MSAIHFQPYFFFFLLLSFTNACKSWHGSCPCWKSSSCKHKECEKKKGSFCTTWLEFIQHAFKTGYSYCSVIPILSKREKKVWSCLSLTLPSLSPFNLCFKTNYIWQDLTDSMICRARVMSFRLSTREIHWRLPPLFFMMPIKFCFWFKLETSFDPALGHCTNCGLTGEQGPCQPCGSQPAMWPAVVQNTPSEHNRYHSLPFTLLPHTISTGILSPSVWRSEAHLYKGPVQPIAQEITLFLSQLS